MYNSKTPSVGAGLSSPSAEQDLSIQGQQILFTIFPCTYMPWIVIRAWQAGPYIVKSKISD